MSNIKIYVEGGGDTRAQQRPCREGFSKFFGKIFPEGKKPKIIACGGRQETYEDFKTAFEKQDTEFAVLLVDSEEPIKENPWDHVKTRDNWLKPNNASDENLYFMTECTENWFFADIHALFQYYGSEFQDNALPIRKDIENIPKVDAIDFLEKASVNTPKGTYKKNHAFGILAFVDPQKLKDSKNSPQANRLIVFVENLP